MVKSAFAALQVTRHPALLAQGVELAVATGEQFVGIGLVAHIPYHPVVVEVEGLVKGKGEFHHPQPRTQVAATGGNGFQMLLADLAGNGLQFWKTHAM